MLGYGDKQAYIASGSSNVGVRMLDNFSINVKKSNDYSTFVCCIEQY